jgi:CRISPR/Cas system-associated exonuclease Cas4 (RecB family)
MSDDLIQWDRSPTMAGMDVLGVRHVSASQIGMYQRCPRQWAMRYVLGLKSPPDGGLVVGSGVHHAAEVGMEAKVETGENPVPDDAAGLAHDYVREEFASGEVVTEGESHESALLDKAARMGAMWAESAAPGVEPEVVEHEFRIEMAGVPVVGRMDVVTKTGSVVDWKTTTRSPSVGDLPKKPQTEVYAAATGGVGVEYVYIVDAKTNPRVVPVVLDDEAVAEAARLASDTVGQTAEGMAMGVWPRNRDGWHCSARWCGYYDRCMSGADDKRLAELAHESRTAVVKEPPP